MSSPNQQSQPSNSQSDAQSTTRRQAKEDHERYVEKLINDHIPHFANLYKKKKGNIKKRKLQESSSTGEDETSSEFVGNNGHISERVFENQETLVKEKAYREIQESRGYNTSTSYCAKQVEFLIFCDQYYARRPLATRHQATGDKLLSFLYQKVVYKIYCWGPKKKYSYTLTNYYFYNMYR